jgi:pimeloyl-ACP methyl ester carboxylesterase
MASTVPHLAAGEDAVVFGTDVRLTGVVTAPAVNDTRHVGVVLLNAGVVHRVGPNRLYVTLARRLSTCGFTVLRFDHSGIGDSDPRHDGLDVNERFVAETVDAMNWLAAERQCREFVLVGLCSGTLTAFRAAQADPRVTNLVLLTALLLDPAAVSDEVVAEAANRRIARSYLVEKMASRGGWRKLLAGKVDVRRVGRVLRRVAVERVRRKPVVAGASEMLAQLQALLDRGVSIRFIYAEPTTVLEGFRMTIAPELPRLRKHGRIEVDLVKLADHTFTQLRHQATVIDSISEWLTRCT